MLKPKLASTPTHLALTRNGLGGKLPLAAGLILCTDKGVLANLEQKLKEMEEECRMEESRRVDLELNIMEVKDNLKKAEAGPVTLGTTVDTTHLENVSPRVSARSHSSSELLAESLLDQGWGNGSRGHISLPLTQASFSSCHHSPELPPPPQTVPQSTLPQHSRAGPSRSWSQAKAPSSRKPR